MLTYTVRFKNDNSSKLFFADDDAQLLTELGRLEILHTVSRIFQVREVEWDIAYYEDVENETYS